MVYNLLYNNKQFNKYLVDDLMLVLCSKHVTYYYDILLINSTTNCVCTLFV